MAEAAVAVEPAKPNQPSLGSIFNQGPSEVAPEKAPVAEASPEKEKPAEEVKEVKPEASPAVEVKPEEKPSLEVKKEEAKLKEEAGPAAEVKLKEEPSQAKSGWEAERETLLKQLKDTRDYATRVNRDNLDTKRQLEIVNKKLDGTYDPAKDDVKPPAPEEILRTGEMAGAAKASLNAAIQMYGKETVEKELNEFHELFADNEIIQQRVINSDMPTVEAIKVMKEYRFVKQHGDDPDKIVDNIRKALIEELTPKIREEESQKLMARLDKKDKEVGGIGGARGDSGIRGEKVVAAPKPLGSIFSH